MVSERERPAQQLSGALTGAMAAAAGIAVANIYYNQPMLGILVRELGGRGLTGFVPTVTQLGYAAGLFLLVPLGDLTDRRRLVVGQFLFLALACAAVALAPSAAAVVVASLALGAASTVAQQVVPFAAALASPERRGRVIGTVMAGVLGGILLSRTVAGFVATQAGWRAVFWLGSLLALGVAGAMAALLPRAHAPSTMRYGEAIASLRGLWQSEATLRRSTVVQALLFASFTAFWTVLALRLEGPHFRLGAGAAGLFGLVGTVGVLAAPLAGRIADRRGPALVIGLGAALTSLSWLLFALWDTLPGLVVGVIALDFGVQGALVSNQHVVFSLQPSARSRLNTVFMTGMFLGGAAGSAGATWAWGRGGWTAVCGYGALLAVAALAFERLGRRGHADRAEPTDGRGLPGAAPAAEPFGLAPATVFGQNRPSLRSGPLPCTESARPQPFVAGPPPALVSSAVTAAGRVFSLSRARGVRVMRLGLISDIHADHCALVRALDILENRGAEKVVCLGDLVEKGPDGDRVVDTLCEHLVVCVRGNHDDNAVRRYHEGDHDEGDPLLGGDAVAFLESLPCERVYHWDGVRVVLSHIAPGGGHEPVVPEQIPKHLKRVLRGYEADLVLLGHTHRPMKIRHGDLWFVNPGSVAGSRLRDSFTCAIVELPSLAVEVFSLHDNEPVALPPQRSAEPPSRPADAG